MTSIPLTLGKIIDEETWVGLCEKSNEINALNGKHIHLLH